MSHRAIILKSTTELASRSSKRTISSKSISRSVDDYHNLVDTIAVTDETDSFTVTNFFEIIPERPVALKITPSGGSQFTLRIHNYFCFTVQTDGSFGIIVANEDDALTCEVNISYS